MNICIFAGARPNFIKIAPIIRAIKALSPSHGVESTLVYVGRSDDPTLEGSLFADLQIAPPAAYLGVDCENLNELTGQVMSQFEKYLSTHSADVVVVVDDLASTMAAAIVTKKQGLLLAHIAAGTRSFDITMPKEINRLVIDGLSDILFTAGISNNSIANREGAELSKVYMVGNVLIDNIRHNQSRLVRPEVLNNLGLADGGYLVFTLNRKALLGNEANLEAMIAALRQSSTLPIVAPLRGQAAEVCSELVSRQADGAPFHIVEPLGYLEFGYLIAHAKGIITDSGNVAEEATFYRVPCITLNSYTEHIETVKQGSNMLVGEDAARLAEAVDNMVGDRWKECTIPDRWDGRSAERIVQTLMNTVTHHPSSTTH